MIPSWFWILSGLLIVCVILDQLRNAVHQRTARRRVQELKIMYAIHGKEQRDLHDRIVFDLRRSGLWDYLPDQEQKTHLHKAGRSK